MLLIYHVGYDNNELNSFTKDNITLIKHWSPESKLLLITDVEYDEDFKKFDDVIKVDTLNDSYSELVNSYTHYHKYNKPSFELQCLGRWFRMYDLIKKNKLQDLLYVENDNLMLCSEKEILNDLYDNHQLQYVSSHPFGDVHYNGGFLYGTEFGLEYLIKYVLDTYKNNRELLEKEHSDGEHISDMWFLKQIYRQNKAGCFRKSAMMRNENYDYDYNLCISNDGMFEMTNIYNNMAKNIYWDENTNHWMCKRYDIPIIMRSVHLAALKSYSFNYLPK